jgi:predicted MFS family arabinose efflux permease
VLGRLLDDAFATQVRHNITAFTVARMATNGAYRFTLPFLATIARGLDVSLADLGVAIAISELTGLASPFSGRLVDRVDDRIAVGGGLTLVTGGALLAAAATNVAVFTVALVLMSLGNIMFVLAINAWIAGHVPYELRGRVTGLTGISWALGLLVGVSTMGLITGLFSVRVAFVVIAVCIVACATVLVARLEPSHGHRASSSTISVAAHPTDGGDRRRTALVLAGAFMLTVSSQSLFVTYGSWLEDTHGFTPTMLAGVTFALGAGELCASFGSAALADRVGKERATALGAALMVPAAAALAAVQDTLLLGLLGVAVAIAGFEFAIVSAIPIGSRLLPGQPAKGLGLLIGSETMGRAVISVPMTSVYAARGLGWPAINCSLAAAIAATLFAGLARKPRSFPAPNAPSA